jgi:hypothetical protein
MTNAHKPAAESPGHLVPDVQVARELNVTLMTLWRWDRDQRMVDLGWPPAICIGRYKYRDGAQYAEFRSHLMRQAIARRNTLFANLRRGEAATHL